MKVLHVETGRHLYGGARQVMYIMDGLQRFGVENILLCQQSSSIAREARQIAEVIPVSLNGDLDFRLFFHLRKLIRRMRPDIVHCHSRRGADIWGGLAAKSLGVPAVLSRRVDNPESAWWVKRKYQMYGKVICISEGIRQVLIKEGLPPGKVTTVRSAIDVNAWEEDCNREAFEQQFEINTNTTVLGMVAQLIPRKGHKLVLQAMHRLHQEYPGLRLICFGQGPLRESLEQEVIRYGLQGKVTFAGFRQDLNKWLGCIDVLVHPAYMEGLGISLIQAAACKVPIIASRAGGMPEIVHHEENGLLIEPGNLEQLMGALTKMLHEPETRQKYGAAGRLLVEKGFSIDHMVEGNLAVYRELLGSGHGHL